MVDHVMETREHSTKSLDEDMIDIYFTPGLSSYASPFSPLPFASFSELGVLGTCVAQS